MALDLVLLDRSLFDIAPLEGPYFLYWYTYPTLLQKRPRIDVASSQEHFRIHVQLYRSMSSYKPHLNHWDIPNSWTLAVLFLSKHSVPNSSTVYG